MNRRHVGVLVAGSLLAASCGGARVAAPLPVEPSPPAHASTAKMTLAQADLGADATVVAGATHAISLEVASHGDPAGVKVLERQTFVNGYQSMFAAGGGLGVLSEASMFRTPEATRRVSAAWKRGEQELQHARFLPAPVDPVGRDMFVLKTRTTAGGVPVPLYIAQWVHGDVIATVAVFGRTASASRVVDMARLQDARIAAELSA
ncbi:MAG: hypothetical protein ACTHNU_18510 [Gaiellales bacterium]